MIKRWLKKHKTLLITFGITSIIFTIITGFQASLLLENLEDLKYYTETGVVTKEMYQYGIFAGLNAIVGLFWLGLLFLLLWKVIFPDYRTVKNAFCVNELEFLIKMPTSVRKELRRKNEQ